MLKSFPRNRIFGNLSHNVDPEKLLETCGRELYKQHSHKFFRKK